MRPWTVKVPGTFRRCNYKVQDSAEGKSRTLSPVSRFGVSTRMDPSDPKSYNHRSVTLNTGRKYHYVDQLPKNYIPDKSLALLLVHGFPDFWYDTQV